MEISDKQKPFKSIPQLISIVCDGCYFYVYEGFSATISKIGSGANGTLAGELIVSSKSLRTCFPELEILSQETLSQENASTSTSNDTCLTFSEARKSVHIVLADGNVRLTCSSSSSDEGHYSTAMLDQSFPVNSSMQDLFGHAYFEISVVSMSSEGGCLVLGWCGADFPLDGSMLGVQSESFGFDSKGEFHGEDEYLDDDVDRDLSDEGHSEDNTVETWSVGDIIGCGINYNTSSIFFTKNGRLLPTHFNIEDTDAEVRLLFFHFVVAFLLLIYFVVDSISCVLL
jgi:hypothetical protein